VAGLFAQFVKALLAPREVVELFIGRLLHLVFDIRITRDNGMPLVEPLGSDLTGMINAHQACRMCSLFLIQNAFLNVARRVRARRLSGRGRNRPQRIVHARKQSIEWCQISGLHWIDYNNDNARRFDNVVGG